MFETKLKIFKGPVDLIPMIDISFILLVYFLISTSYDFQPGLKVNLPTNKLAPVVAGNKLVVVITTKGDPNIDTNIVTYFNNKQVTLAELSNELNAIINQRSLKTSEKEEDSQKSLDLNNRRPTISLKVDQDVPYKHVQKIFQIAYERKVNINQVVKVAD